jgi:tetratricopeptide (TPR) repeat protein
MTFGLLAIGHSQGVAADQVSDCAQGRDLALRVKACGQIIAGAGFTSEQKAAAFRHRGQARAEAGALDDAVLDLTEAIRLNTEDAAAYDARGSARLAKGATDQAIADFSTAVRLVPQNVSFLIGRGHAFLVKGNPDAAIIDFSEAIRINPKSASAWNNKGLAWRRKGNIEQAVTDFTAAIALNPVYAVAYLNRGYAHEAAGRRAQAVADLTRALELDRTLVGAGAALKRLKVSSEPAERSARAVAEGKSLAEQNCARCHAVGTSGQSPNPKAPAFRLIQQRHPILALREPLARSIAAPHDEMPQFLLPEADIDRIVAYINSMQSGTRGWEPKTTPGGQK